MTVTATISAAAVATACEKALTDPGLRVAAEKIQRILALARYAEKRVGGPSAVVTVSEEDFALFGGLMP